MFSLKYAIGRAVRVSVASPLTKSRTLTTATPSILRSTTLIPRVALQRRWLSDEGARVFENRRQEDEVKSYSREDRTGRASPTPKESIFVGNLFYDVTAEDLKEEFKKFGSVLAARIIYDARGLSRGFGYLRFADQETAQKAIDEMHGKVFEGRRLTLNYAQLNFTNKTRSENISAPTRTVFVGNMAFEMTDRDLQDLFKDIHNVVDVRVAVDRRTGQPRGFAHAEFVDVESAKRGFDILATKAPYGRTLRLDYSHSSKAYSQKPPVEGQTTAAESEQPSEPAQVSETEATQAEAAQPQVQESQATEATPKASETTQSST